MESLRPEILRVLAGDHGAAAWLYDTYAPELLRRLRLRFGPVPGLDPEDLLQDTFLYLLSGDGAALRRFLEVEPRRHEAEAFRVFLWNAACGVASNKRRAVQRRPTQSIGEFKPPDPRQGGERPAIARDVLERLGDCLNNRGGRLYLYYQFRYLDGLKPSEIVATTGWSSKVTYKLKQILDEAVEKCAQDLGLEAP